MHKVVIYSNVTPLVKQLASYSLQYISKSISYKALCENMATHLVRLNRAPTHPVNFLYSYYLVKNWGNRYITKWSKIPLSKIV